jgi:hypothetical protein
MVEFTPTPADGDELAIWDSERLHRGSRARLAYALGTLVGAFVLGTAVSGGAAALLGLPPGPPAFIGFWGGLAAGVVLILATPELRRSWSDRRAAKIARWSWRPRGLVQVWLDPAGLNIGEGGVHTHVLWSGIAGVFDIGGQVLLPINTGAQICLPKRAGENEVNDVALTVTGVRAGTVLPPPAPKDLPARPAPGPRASLELTVDVSDIGRLFEDALRLRPAAAAERHLKRASAIFGFIAGALLGLALGAATGQLHGVVAGLLPMVVGAVLALLTWSLAGPFITQQARKAVANMASNELAAGGGRRLLWLERDGLGWSDDVTSRKAEWAAIQVTQGPEHYLIHTADCTDGVVIPHRVGPDGDAFIADLGQHQRAWSRKLTEDGSTDGGRNR